MPESVAGPKEWRERIDELELKDDHLLAFDTARAAAEAWPDEPHFAYLAVRNLARCGATSAALAAYEAYGLGAHRVRDYRALRARDTGPLRARSRHRREVFATPRVRRLPGW